MVVLAHRTRIIDNLPWNRKSYLTHAILPRLSLEGFIHWLYWNSRTLCHCYVQVTPSCDIASKRIQGLLEVYVQIKSSSEQEKESVIRVRVG